MDFGTASRLAGNPDHTRSRFACLPRLNSMNALLSTLALAYRTILRNPQYRGWVILGSLIYLISPLDLSPDIVPILGQIDDVALMALLFSELSKMVAESVRDRSLFAGFRRDTANTAETAGSTRSTPNPAASSADANYTQTIDVEATIVDRPNHS